MLQAMLRNLSPAMLLQALAGTGYLDGPGVSAIAERLSASSFDGIAVSAESADVLLVKAQMPEGEVTIRVTLPGTPKKTLDAAT